MGVLLRLASRAPSCEQICASAAAAMARLLLVVLHTVTEPARDPSCVSGSGWKPCPDPPGRALMVMDIQLGACSLARAPAGTARLCEMEGLGRGKVHLKRRSGFCTCVGVQSRSMDIIYPYIIQAFLIVHVSEIHTYM